MQTRDAIERVAAECAEDLAADGVVYAEIRYAPEQHIEAGLTIDEVVDAVTAGFAAGSTARGITDAVDLCRPCASRPTPLEIAELAVRHRDIGVVGFDIAGPEKGFPPTRHLDAFQYVQRENFHMTIHAGEAFGLPSIWEAIQFCGAERLGHGVRIVDDIEYDADGRGPPRPAGRLRAGPAHPAGDVPDLQRRHGRRDVRSPSTPSSSPRPALPGHGQHRQPADERHLHVGRVRRHCTRRSAGASTEMRWLTVNALKSAFVPFDERLRHHRRHRQARLREAPRDGLSLGCSNRVRGR